MEDKTVLERVCDTNKYKNIKCIYKGIIFHSKKEMNRYMELEWLQKAGKIRNLELQPKFLLQEAFLYKEEKIRPIYYIADFKYIQDGKEIIEDVKGKKTKEYLIKKKIFLLKYKEKINFIEIV